MNRHLAVLVVATLAVALRAQENKQAQPPIAVPT